MHFRNTQSSYGAGAKLAHWLTFLLLCVSFKLGWTMTDLPVSPLRLKLYSYHKWVGVTIFVLVAARLLWRLATRQPDLPAHMAAWERNVAGATYALLYLLLFAAPLSGWLMSSAKGFQTVFLGVLPIPDLIGKNPELGKFLEVIHGLLTWALLALFVLHALAALKHHFIDRDEVLARMLPGLRPKSGSPS